jgi:hypothetical protein
MRYLTIFVLATGCIGSHGLHMGPSAKEEAAAVQAQADSLRHNSEVARDAYFTCMASYGASHAANTATATEIAAAASSSCSRPLGAFMRAYDEDIAFNTTDPISVRDAERRQYARMDLQAKIEEQGSQWAVRAVVEKRKP